MKPDLSYVGEIVAAFRTAHIDPVSDIMLAPAVATVICLGMFCHAA